MILTRIKRLRKPKGKFNKAQQSKSFMKICSFDKYIQCTPIVINYADVKVIILNNATAGKSGRQKPVLYGSCNNFCVLMRLVAMLHNKNSLSVQLV